MGVKHTNSTCPFTEPLHRRVDHVMKQKLVLLSLFLLSALPLLAARVGDAAPAFMATDTNGHQHNLSQYKGRFVVLEWTNQGCPYTRKHYESGNMQRLQKEWTSRGVVWLTVISSAPGQQGYVTAEQENDYVKRIGRLRLRYCLIPKATSDTCTLQRLPRTCS